MYFSKDQRLALRLIKNGKIKNLNDFYRILLLDRQLIKKEKSVKPIKINWVNNNEDIGEYGAGKNI